MRNLLILSVLMLTAGSTGCTRGPCGETWRPGYYLFGVGRQNYQNYQKHLEYPEYLKHLKHLKHLEYLEHLKHWKQQEQLEFWKKHR